ncbi:hypothetical protein WME99_32895 [Sorangium sp. So ce136]|uniref:hypothetical protein n=1 Tax=Sorangium sp. So ce136 TaxID=3133284 RepID=UPI003F0EACBB
MPAGRRPPLIAGPPSRSARWLSEIDRFMKLRELVPYTAIRRVGRREALDPWCRAYLERHGQRILDDRPVWPEAG